MGNQLEAANQSSLYGMLAKSIIDRCDEVPPGFIPRSEYQAMWNLGPSATKNRINELVRAGKMEKTILKIRVNGFLVTVPHYRPLIEKKSLAAKSNR